MIVNLDFILYSEIKFNIVRIYLFFLYFKFYNMYKRNGLKSYNVS